MTASAHYKLYKHQQLRTKLVQVQYEPSSDALQTTCTRSPASFADPIWTRNEQQARRHQAPEECLSPLMPAAKLYKSLLTNCGVQLRLYNASLEKPLLVGIMWNRVCGQWRRTNLKVGEMHFRDSQYSLASLLFAVQVALWSRRHCLWLCSGWR